MTFIQYSEREGVSIDTLRKRFSSYNKKKGKEMRFDRHCEIPEILQTERKAETGKKRGNGNGNGNRKTETETESRTEIGKGKRNRNTEMEAENGTETINGTESGDGTENQKRKDKIIISVFGYMINISCIAFLCFGISTLFGAAGVIVSLIISLFLLRTLFIIENSNNYTSSWMSILLVFIIELAGTFVHYNTLILTSKTENNMFATVGSVVIFLVSIFSLYNSRLIIEENEVL